MTDLLFFFSKVAAASDMWGVCGDMMHLGLNRHCGECTISVGTDLPFFFLFHRWRKA